MAQPGFDPWKFHGKLVIECESCFPPFPRKTRPSANQTRQWKMPELKGVWAGKTIERNQKVSMARHDYQRLNSDRGSKWTILSTFNCLQWWLAFLSDWVSWELGVPGKCCATDDILGFLLWACKFWGNTQKWLIEYMHVRSFPHPRWANLWARLFGIIGIIGICFLLAVWPRPCSRRHASIGRLYCHPLGTGTSVDQNSNHFSGARRIVKLNQQNLGLRLFWHAPNRSAAPSPATLQGAAQAPPNGLRGHNAMSMALNGFQNCCHPDSEKVFDSTCDSCPTMQDLIEANMGNGSSRSRFNRHKMPDRTNRCWNKIRTGMRLRKRLCRDWTKSNLGKHCSDCWATRRWPSLDQNYPPSVGQQHCSETYS